MFGSTVCDLLCFSIPLLVFFCFFVLLLLSIAYLLQIIQFALHFFCVPAINILNIVATKFANNLALHFGIHTLSYTKRYFGILRSSTMGGMTDE